MKLMKHLILSCKKATELVEKKEIQSLSFVENIQLKTHMAMCKACANYKRQSLGLGKLIKEYYEKNISTKDRNEIDPLDKEQLRESVRKNIGRS